MYGYIYLTTNLINGKKYVGKHKSSYFNPEYKGSGTLLWKAINKYGWDNFKVEIVKECETLEELNLSEAEEITRRDAISSEEYYNLNSGGAGGFEYINSNRDKIVFPSPKVQGSLNPNYGNPSNYHHSEEIKKQMSEGQRRYFETHGHGTRKGKPNKNPSVEFTQERRERISEAMTGREWVSRDLDDGTVERHLVPEKEVEQYVSCGFVVGYGKRTKSPIKGKLRMIKDGRVKYCFPEEYEEYVSNGYVRSTGNFVKKTSSTTIESVDGKKDSIE